MTSGEFTSVPISNIWVDRATRQRRDLEGIPELMDSIRRVGLIHPPVITREFELKTGERRFTACKELGWESIPVQFVDELDEIELQLLEYEENTRRINLPWEDECNAVYHYHLLQSSRSPNWTQAETASMLGQSEQTVSAKIAVAKELAAGNTRVAEAPKLSVAIGVVTRHNERKADSAVASALKVLAPARPDVKPVPLLNEDFNTWSKTYSGPKFNFIHCDFPYGIGADKHDQGQAAAQGGYADTKDVYDQLLQSLRDFTLGGGVADSAHLVFWFSMDYYEFTRLQLNDMGWAVNPFPLTWYKSDNTGVLPDAQRGFRRGYETAFFGIRGDRKLTAKGAVNNVCAWPGRDKELHMSEKPQGMLKHFFGSLVDEFTSFLDPTCGSANSVKVAQSLGAKHVLGLEINKEFFDRSSAAYYD